MTPNNPRPAPSLGPAPSPAPEELVGATLEAVGLLLDQVTLDSEDKRVAVPANKVFELVPIVPIVFPLLVSSNIDADVIIVLLAELVFGTAALELETDVLELDAVVATTAYVNKAAESVAIGIARSCDVAAAPVMIVDAILVVPGINSVA
ncbi:hypothetical protein BOTNAR_0329g00120 [Botryotinia narcissicola]|uniref:Uncharacterized protein n=1 Tax=Botryotinia narcissicola TaxID=278944 RepID=A0A4Z1HT47_9HELO|nr:hypothetical protein BOTNAR_0329g00120 [Botryotinia narcissicola]